MERQRLSDVFGIGRRSRFIAPRSTIRPAITSSSANLLFPLIGDPSGSRLLLPRLFPAFNLSLPARQRSMPTASSSTASTSTTGSTWWAAPRRRALTYLQTPSSSGDLSFGYDYSAYGPADPIPVGDPTGGITVKPEIGPDADSSVLVVLQRPLAGTTRSATRRGATSRSTSGSPTRRWAAGSTPTEVSGVLEGILHPTLGAAARAGAPHPAAGSASATSAHFFGLGGYRRAGRPARRVPRAAAVRLPARLSGQHLRGRQLSGRLGRIPGAAALDRARLPDVPGSTSGASGARSSSTPATPFRGVSCRRS